MLKRHCDLCDSVIIECKTHYSLVKKTQRLFNVTDSIELDICEECLEEIIKRKNEKCEVEE